MIASKRGHREDLESCSSLFVVVSIFSPLLSEKFSLPIAGLHCQMLAYIASHRKPIQLCSGAILLLQVRSLLYALLILLFFLLLLYS